MAKILLVEDDKPSREMLSRRLQRLGHHVITAADGQRAVAAATEDLPDVILMDLNLPVLDGWSATRQIKNASNTSGIPVIVLTAHAMRGDRERALGAGCDDFDTKPVDLPRLLGKIDAALGRKGSDDAGSSVLRAATPGSGARTAVPPTESTPAGEPTCPTATRADAPGCTGRVLVVDDTAANRNMLSRRLARAGFTVETAADGREALRMARAEGYDLILLDVMMPEVSGLEVLAELRRDRPPTELPIIMATARDASQDVVQALELGANDYVTKPLDFPVVLARVRTQLALKRSVEQIRSLERDLKQRNGELESVNERMRLDLEAGAQVQAALLPSAKPVVPGYDFAWLFTPSAGLAGDIFNVFRLDDRYAGMYVLDVSGHGVAAALLSVSVSRFLSPTPHPTSLLWEWNADGSEYHLSSPTRVAERLCERFPFDVATKQYFTLLYGVLDLQEHRLRYVSAGHPNLIHASPGQDPVLLAASGFPIGVVEADYDEYAVDLRPGDRLWLYSDGLPEAMNADQDAFGYDGMLDVLRAAAAGRPLEETLVALSAALRAWSGPAEVQDDQTVLCFERAL